MKELIKKVVLVDDDQDDRDLFSDAVAGLNANILLKTYPDAHGMVLEIESGSFEMPDMMFLDINMPGISGFELLEKMRNIKQYAKLPIIAIYSTSSDSDDKSKSIRLGANGYITKPSNFAGLQKVISEALGRDWSKSAGNFDL